MPGLRIATLEQEIQLVQGLNRSTGRRVGIYPEIKNPAWHRAHGIDLARALIATLERFGYRNTDDLAFVQCFDAAELARVRDELGSGLRLVQLVGTEPEFASLLARDGLEKIARYANGLGPAYAQLIAGDAAALRPTRLLLDAREVGLAVHAYTFRADALPAYAANLGDLLRFFIAELRLEGIFCDHPDVAIAVRNAVAHGRS
jgi:glycerophosphoryl diester phosphodiesterase